MYITHVFSCIFFDYMEERNDQDGFIYITMQISLSSMVFDHWSKKGLFLCIIFHDICDMYITLVFSLSTKKIGMFVTTLCK